MKKAFLIAVIIIIVAVVFSRKETHAPIVEEIDRGPVSQFQWSYKTFEEKEIPRTTISLTARYADNTSVTKEIDTVEGSCNDYDSTDKDVAAGSTLIICYYAGLGHYFKVTTSGTEYLVQRKTFEEGSPEYNPPQLPFETIARF